MPVERILARGHEHVRATHGSTLEVTTDDWLTPAGDCIVGVAADRAPADFDTSFRDAARDAEAEIVMCLTAGSLKATISGRGDPALTFASDRSMVVRTSTYVDDRTVMVGADASAASIDRDLVDTLANEGDLEVTLRITT